MIENVEVCDTASVAALVDAISEPLDVVINNAGYFPNIHETITDPANPLNFEEELKQIDVCAVLLHTPAQIKRWLQLGPLRVSSALFNAGKIKAGEGKIVIISSQVRWLLLKETNGI